MTGNDGQQYPEPTPEYWETYPQEPQQPTYEQPQQPQQQPPAAYGQQQPPAQPDPYGYQQQPYQAPGYPYGYDAQQVPQQAQPQQPTAPGPGPGGYPTGAYDTGGYDTGSYDTGQYGAAAPYAAGGYQADQYGAGGYPGGGPYAAPQAAPGGYPAAQPAAQPAAAQPAAQAYAAPPAAPAPPAPAAPAAARPAPAGARPVPPQRTRPAAPGAASRGPADRYGMEEFTFVDDAEESEDVIDWMKFSETRGERRDERRRRIRGRVLILAVALVVLAGSGAGYLLATGRLGSSRHTVAAASGREVIAVHLHDLSDHVYTALLVSDTGTHKATTLLVPGNLNVPQESGGQLVPLASSVDTQGNAAIRTGLNTLLGSDVTASWGLYTSFLQVLVDRLNGITIDSDTTITQGGKVLVKPGTSTVNGAAAVAYATYQAPGEDASAQLTRFGQVLEGVIKAMPQDPTSAAADITAMGEVADPSLPDSTLGALLAALSTDAASGRYQTATLPVQADGSLGAGADSVAQQLLGGSVSSGSGQTAAARVSLVNASGDANNTNLAGATITNNGYTWVPGSTTAAPQAASTISYTQDSRAADARRLAEDLNLPATAVRKVTTQQTVDLLVVLGRDYHQD
ncbi:LCP family protein [Streptacidiphilus sp. PB12-B1b]|uniref:LCP family protein n=1 Tax=Streptacidiphilus sp. PB12-B1b TaxID=2705012 RepID=UPI0015FCF036|nr:LCP family protein [Streptacidiphilus sp. PB12-B1b]QMU75555.1 LCP family protein [Streptacidiphilus sp. PB12-B1b]